MDEQYDEVDQVFRCPKCGENDDFKIDATINTVAYVNGRGEVEDSQDGDMEWGGESRMFCKTCDYMGIVNEFELEDQDVACTGPCVAGLMPGESCEDCGKVADIADMMQGQGGCTG